MYFITLISGCAAVVVVVVVVAAASESDDSTTRMTISKGRKWRRRRRVRCARWRTEMIKKERKFGWRGDFEQCDQMAK